MASGEREVWHKKKIFPCGLRKGGRRQAGFGVRGGEIGLLPSLRGEEHISRKEGAMLTGKGKKLPEQFSCRKEEKRMPGGRSPHQRLPPSEKKAGDLLWVEKKNFRQMGWENVTNLGEQFPGVYVNYGKRGTNQSDKDADGIKG